MFPNITTAKVIYAYENRFFLLRGGSIKSKGFIQYKSLCDTISSKPFFRGGTYSYGDYFIENGYRVELEEIKGFTRWLEDLFCKVCFGGYVPDYYMIISWE